VAPGFLANAGQTYVLEYASKQETPEPDAVTVREVLGATRGQLSLAYRVLEVRADRYGLGGEDLLEDRAGRTIRVFEGLVLQLPAERVLSIGLTAEDLAAVTLVTAPAFRKLWAAETRIEAEASTAIPVGGATSDARPLNLRIAEPYVVPGSGAQRAKIRASRHGDQKDISVIQADSRPAIAREPRPGRTRLIAAIVVVCALAVLLAWFVARP